MSERKYTSITHQKLITVTKDDGEPEQKLVPYAFTLINRERQRAKAFRVKHGGLSGRQFKRARKAGNRLAREQARAQAPEQRPAA